MKTLNFNKDSIHYRLANISGDFSQLDDHDLCSYTRYVMAGFLISMLILFLGVVAWHLLVSAVLGVIFSLVYGMLIFTHSGVVGSFIILFFTTFFGILYILQYRKDRKRAKAKMNRELGVPPKPDSFLVNAYKGWKEKYCVRVTFGE